KSIPQPTQNVAGAWKQPYQPIYETESRITMITFTPGEHFNSRALRIAAVLAAVACSALHRGTVFAQAPQPGPKPAAEQQDKAQQVLAHAQVLEQLTHQIEALKTE